MEPFLDCYTLIDTLENRPEHDPAWPLYTFLADGEREWDVVTAAALAAWLDPRYLGNQRILLLFQQGLTFVASFFECVHVGVCKEPSWR